MNAAIRFLNSPLRSFLNPTNVVALRCLHLTDVNLGSDARDHRIGHKRKSDRIEGEQGVYVASESSYELIDENLFDRLINNVKFKDIPIIHIKCTRNNTKVTLCRGDGSRWVTKTAGTEGFKNCRKGTTVAAQAVANRILTIARDNEVHMARMVFNGLGPGRNAAYKVFELANFNIVSLSDRTQAAEPYNLRPRGAKSL